MFVPCCFGNIMELFRWRVWNPSKKSNLDLLTFRCQILSDPHALTLLEMGGSKEWRPDQNFLIWKVLESVSFLSEDVQMLFKKTERKLFKELIYKHHPTTACFLFYKNSLVVKIIWKAHNLDLWQMKAWRLSDYTRDRRSKWNKSESPALLYIRNMWVTSFPGLGK